MITHIGIPGLVLLTSAMLVIAGLYTLIRCIVTWRK